MNSNQTNQNQGFTTTWEEADNLVRVALYLILVSDMNSLPELMPDSLWAKRPRGK